MKEKKEIIADYMLTLRTSINGDGQVSNHIHAVDSRSRNGVDGIGGRNDYRYTFGWQRTWKCSNRTDTTILTVQAAGTADSATC